MSSSDSDDSLQNVSEDQDGTQKIRDNAMKETEPKGAAGQSTGEMSTEQPKMRLYTRRTILSPARFTYGCNVAGARKTEAGGTGTAISSSDATASCNSAEPAVKRKREDSGVVNLFNDDEQEETINEQEEREGEVLVFKAESKIYFYSPGAREWVKNVNGSVYLYDYETDAGGLQSRLFVRSIDDSCTMLNRKVCSGMVPTKRSRRTLRLTVPSKYGQYMVFWFTVSQQEFDFLFAALTDRIEKEKANMSLNYLTRYAANMSSAKRRALGQSKDNQDRLDPAELD